VSGEKKEGKLYTEKKQKDFGSFIKGQGRRSEQDIVAGSKGKGGVEKEGGRDRHFFFIGKGGARRLGTFHI